MPNHPPTRGQLATTIRESAVRLHHFDTKGGEHRKALNEASKLVLAATKYEQLLIEQVGFLPCPGTP